MAIAADKVADKTENTAPAKPSLEKILEKRKALGRGLDSLLSGVPRIVSGTSLVGTSVVGTSVAATAPPVVPGAAPTPGPVAVPADAVTRLEPVAAQSRTDGDPLLRNEVLQLSLDQLKPNPYQTRSSVDEKYLAELAQSITTHGVLQPVIVRPAPDGKYFLIAGECRWRASHLAGKTSIPAIVRHVSDQQALELTIVENLQRHDLNCVDQARAFARLSSDFGLTQEEIGKRTGCSRESVSNYMRLLKLPVVVQNHLSTGELDFSQARVLLRLLDPSQAERIAELAIKKHLSVMQMEALVAETNLPPSDKTPTAPVLDPNVKAAQTELERLLGVRIKIRDRQGKGKIVIEYKSLEDFDRVLGMLKGER